MGVAFLSVGSRVWHDGEMWKVVALAADRATIESAAGARSVSVVELLAAAGTRLLDAPPDEAVPAIGPLLANLTEHERIQLEFRLGHVREVLTGFRSGQVSNPADGEPRPDYQPSRALMDRYRAKAAELGVDPATVRRWVAAYQAEGEAGLVDGRRHRRADPLAGVDGRWRDELDAVLAEHVGASRPPRHLLLERVDARVEQRYGPGTVVLPSAWKANLVVSEVTRGTNALRGSTKAKRSIANRPDAPYGRLHATRPGEYPASGHHPTRRVRHGPPHPALGQLGAHDRVGSVQPLHRRFAVVAGVDQGGRRRPNRLRGDMPDVDGPHRRRNPAPRRCADPSPGRRRRQRSGASRGGTRNACGRPRQDLPVRAPAERVRPIGDQRAAGTAIYPNGQGRRREVFQDRQGGPAGRVAGLQGPRHLQPRGASRG